MISALDKSFATLMSVFLECRELKPILFCHTNDLKPNECGTHAFSRRIRAETEITTLR